MANTPSPSLAELQRRIRSAVTRRAPPEQALAAVVDAAPLSAPERLGVYTQAYLLRLVECLAADFPATRRALGANDFHQLAADYFSLHPSSSPNISDSGEELSEFTRTHSLGEAYSFLPDLTALEWAVLSSLYTDRWPALDTSALQAVPAGAWAGARLKLDPTVRLFKTQWAVEPLWNTRRDPERKRRAAVRKLPRALLLYRDEHWVQLKLLDEPRWITLKRLSEGTALGVVCEELPAQFPAQSLPVMKWFPHWVRAGIIKKIEF